MVLIDEELNQLESYISNLANIVDHAAEGAPIYFFYWKNLYYWMILVGATSKALKIFSRRNCLSAGLNG